MISPRPTNSMGSGQRRRFSSYFGSFAGLKGPKLWWTSFYDDFTVFSDARALTSAAVSAEALLDLWGVKFAKDGKKAVDFSATVKSLGLLIGLDTILEGRIRIMHTPERKAELEEALKGILEAGELTCKHSEQLRGRRLWKSFLGFSQVVYYIDNEAARTAFIRGTGATTFTDRWIVESCRLEAGLQIKSWFARCPSVSNPADSPSRLECEELQALGCTQDKVEWEAVPEFPLATEDGGEAAGSETNSPPFVPV